MDQLDEALEQWGHGQVVVPMMVAFVKIEYGGNGMRIYLQELDGDRRFLVLSFRDLPTAVRISNESQRLASLRLLPSSPRHSFYLVKNSNFLAWINADSLGICQNDPLSHLAIVTDEEWIDLIYSEPPKITFSSAKPTLYPGECSGTDPG